MKFIPLRSAVIAGTCAVALSFVSVPAFASTTGTDAGGESTTALTVSATADSGETDTPSGDSTAEPSDQATTASTGSEPSDEPTPAPVDSQPSDEATAAPTASEPSDEATPESDATETPGSALPDEKGHPKQEFEQTVFLPRMIAKQGIHVTYTGLTPKATYQPFYNGGQSGGELGKAKRANAKGVIEFVYHFGKSEKWATTVGSSFAMGLLGHDTDLRIEQQVEVKYDSDIAFTTARHGTSVHLAATVEKADKSGKDSAWKKVAVHFQKKVGTKWVTVKTVKTNGKGAAKATIKAGRSMWRAVVDSGTVVAGTTTKGHKK